MFTTDIIHLRQFYASFLGEQSAGLIKAAIMRLWPKLHNDTLLVIGHGAQYIEDYCASSEEIFISMPAQQGASFWSAGKGGRVFLSSEAELPVADNSLNRVLLIHSLEHSEQLSWMMREVWRVLTPGGRVLAIAPNRNGLWAGSTRSPFGHGRPFNHSQLRALLSDHHFTITRSDSALFMPPIQKRFVWKLANILEKLGRHCLPFIGGIVLVEAEKQLYASLQEPVALRRRTASVLMPKPIISNKH